VGNPRRFKDRHRIDLRVERSRRFSVLIHDCECPCLQSQPQQRLFIGRDAMNYPAFTNDSLTMMYEGIRGALAADDALKRQGMGARFRVRETPEWKLHAADLETEMLGRGMMFDVIDWSEDQARLPFEE
jgi:hypothetical protein